MLRLTLKHYATGSAIIQLEDSQQLAQLTYTRKTHKHESSADYARIVTQLKTYGEKEALEEFNRIKIKQEQDAKAKAAEDYEKEVRLNTAYDIIGRLDD